MSYVVLARKYRPMSFDDLVGQEHVARTLSNAIAQQRVAHAFLFTGVRGVGKTTSARILAKALNCMGRPGTVAPGTDPGPTASPCLACPACLEITAGTDVDVQEIDGASYNGVDEVRKLQDSLPYRPARDRHKIVIVDEVHMLTSSAWNAFLKTLEEPPAHVKFIFATTEVHKVPVTILSRVQRFDFKLISARAIVERLRSVLARESVTADDAALSVVAREAAGSMRDAMSLLDQVIAWGGSELVGEDVARVLGVASRRVLHEIAGALVAGRADKCLRVTQSLAEQGHELGHVARDLLALLRDLVVAKVCSEPDELLDLPDEERAEVARLAAQADGDDLMRLYQGFSRGFDDVVRSGQPRAALEMLLVRLARRPPLLPLDELLVRVGALERRLGAGRSDPRGGAASPAPPPATPPRPPPAQVRTAPVGAALDLPETAAFEPPANVPPPVELAPPTPPTPSPQPEPLTPALSAPSEAPASASVEVTATPPLANAASRAPPGDETLPAWRRILARVGEDSAAVAAFFGHAVPLEVEATSLIVAFEVGSVFAEQAAAPDAVRLVERAAAAELGGSPRLVVERESARTRGRKTVATVLTQEREAARAQAIADATSHAAVREAIAVLGARVKDVRLPEA